MAPVSWLVEVTHSLSWSDAHDGSPVTHSRRIHCLHALQIWDGALLAQSLDAQAVQFGFTPSYMGAPVVSGFAWECVRVVEGAFTGMFEPGLSGLFGALGERWVLLGNMSALCPTEDAALFQPLHLPFISLMSEASELEPLRQKMRPPSRSKASVLHMSRHDVLGTRIRFDASTATPAGLLAAPPPKAALAFARAALPADTLSGAALAARWFGNDGSAVEFGLHVEQIQLPGKSKKRPLLPHPFPRAAVMLYFLRKQKATDEQPALSVLVRFSGTKKVYNVTVRTVQIQPAPAATTRAADVLAPAELVIGSVNGLVSLPVDSTMAGPEHDRQLLAIAMRHVSAPAFLVQRQASAERRGKGAGSYTLIELPALAFDQLAFASRPLRASTVFSSDGRLTWPESKFANALTKQQLDTIAGARTPFQHVALDLAGTRSRLLPARVAGEVFNLDGNNVPSPGGEAHSPEDKTHSASTVWLQEWEKVAFASERSDPEDAIPRDYDSAVAVRPMAPSASAVAAAIGRMDPALLKAGTAFMQTYLPPVIDDVDLPTRLATMTETGMRALRTWDDGAGRVSAQALAGLAVTRSMRMPRPSALPMNAGPIRSWHRTVGWYGAAASSCLALEGAWDMLVGPPGESGIPDWCVLFGKPRRVGLGPIVANQEQMWNGAIAVNCKVFTYSKGVSTLHPEPAYFVIALLSKEKDTVRAGARCGAKWIDYHRAQSLDDRHIEFSLQTKLLQAIGNQDCTFECGWLVVNVKGDYVVSGSQYVIFPPQQTRKELDKAAFRKLVLRVPRPASGGFPLPLIRRSVFFSDPAYDHRLSRVKALSDSAELDSGARFSLWVDRPSVTVQESIVVRAFSPPLDDPSKDPTFILSASVRRKKDDQAAPPPLRFLLDPLDLSSPQWKMNLVNSEYYVLPVSMLVDANGARLLPGDTLRLELTAGGKTPVRLLIPVRAQTSLAAPEALYSLIAVDADARRAWCAAHSSAPQPEGLDTYVTGEDKKQHVERRALFKWTVTEAYDRHVDGLSICKMDLSTESTHVPDKIEGVL